MRTREYVPLDFDEYPDFGMPRESWLAARRMGIGSSDAAAILGLDRFKTPASVYFDKIGERPPDDENDMMHFGRKLESVVAAEFEDRSEWEWLTRFPDAMYQHVELDFALASPDRIAINKDPNVEQSILEIKTGRNTDIWEVGPPSSYVLQVQHQLEVCGLEQAHLAVLLNGRDYRSFEIERDPILCEMLMERESEFWALVEKRQMPAVDGQEATTEALKRVYDSASLGASVVLTTEQAEAIAAYKETRDRLKVVKARHDEAGNVLRAALGNAEVGIFNGDELVTWKAPTKGAGRVDLDALELDHPELVAKYRKPVTSRTLRVK